MIKTLRDILRFVNSNGTMDGGFDCKLYPNEVTRVTTNIITTFKRMLMLNLMISQYLKVNLFNNLLKS